MQQTALHRETSVSPALSSLFSGSLLRAPRVLFDSLLALQSRAEERRQLRRLTDHQLRDMGLTRSEAEDMANRAVWSRRV